ncbi:MAG: gamma-glutamyltransferase, partial [Planctomycetota bacterium]
MLKNLLLLTSCFLGVNGSLRELRGQESVRSEYADRGMVVSDSSHASRIGRDIIARGGNAVDAAVATAFAMTVTWPEAGNIGGGGFMLIRPANGMPPVCIDYRETAPIASRGDMFEIGENRYTRKLVGVPGTVRGLELAHERYGSLPWKDLVLPATRLATDGFSVDSFLADSTNRILDATKDDPLYKELHRVYGKPNGARWAVGDVMKLPDLGRTLVVIAEQGADAFYEGRLADLLLDEMNRSGGLIRRQDLVSYKAVVREPIIGSYRDYKIIGAPPPSSGGIAIVQGLNMVEAVDLPREKFT